MSATPTLLSAAQIAARLAAYDKATAVSVAIAAGTTPVDQSPLAAIAVAAGAGDVQAALGLVPIPPPASARMHCFMLAR